MNTVDVGGTLEVTSLAVGVAVVAQRAGEAVGGTVVESTEVSQEKVRPLKGGVQKVGGPVSSNPQVSPAKRGIAAQETADFLNTYDENERQLTVAPVSKSAIAKRAPVDHIQSFRDDLPIAAKPGKMGRPMAMTPETIEQICLLLSIGFTRRQAAIYLGISPGSLTNAVSRDAEIGTQFRHAEELQTIHPELTVMAEARKNWRAAAWYLQYKAKTPRQLSEEEKEERHQADMADRRRAAEHSNQLMRDTAASIRAYHEEEEKGRSPSAMPTPAEIRAAMEEVGQRRKKKVRGK